MICELDGQLSFGFESTENNDRRIDDQIEILLNEKSNDVDIIDALLVCEKSLSQMTPFQYAKFVICFTKFFMKFVHVKSIFKDVMWKIFHKIIGDHLRQEGVI